MTVRAPSPLKAAVGLAAVTVDELRRLPALTVDELRRLPGLLGTASSAARERYEELALHGSDVLSGRRPAPADDLAPAAETPAEAPVAEVPVVEVPVTEPPAPRPPIGLTEVVELPEPVLDEVAQLPSGAELDHADLPLPDFDHLTVPQLRGRLRTLTLPALVQLRDYEQAHARRMPVLTLLDNRMAKLSEAPGHSSIPQ